MRLQSISIVGAGYVMASVYVVMSLVVYVVLLRERAHSSESSVLAIPSLPGRHTETDLVLFPLLMGLVGFCVGAFFATIYNLMAKLTGGLVLTMRNLDLPEPKTNSEAILRNALK